MKPARILICAFCLLSWLSFAQNASAPKPSSPQPAAPQNATATTAGGTGSLQSVLADMDRAAASFKSAQADLVWEQYQKVVNETDTQTGTIYFRRNQKQTEMAVDIKTPDAKYVLFGGNKLRVYQPSIDQVTEYNTGKNSADFEAFLVLGFGGAGHDLLNSFDVKYVGTEQVGGVNAAKLELIPKSQRVRGVFNRILLWINPATGISVQQQFFEPESGNYRLTKYSNVRLNQKISDDVFKLKTTGKTKIVRPNG